MSDLISRAGAIDAICATAFSINTIYGRSERGMAAAKEAVKVLKALPTAEPSQHWIPVSERLPKKGTYCLICTEDGYVDVDTYYLYGWDDFGNVIAWQPFPDPYQEEPT